MSNEGAQFIVVHGGLSMAAREEAFDTFKTTPECHVLVATPGAAKEGLRLTVANHAVFYDRSFSPAIFRQALMPQKKRSLSPDETSEGTSVIPMARRRKGITVVVTGTGRQCLNDYSFRARLRLSGRGGAVGTESAC